MLWVDFYIFDEMHVGLWCEAIFLNMHILSLMNACQCINAYNDVWDEMQLMEHYNFFIFDGMHVDAWCGAIFLNSCWYVDACLWDWNFLVNANRRCILWPTNFFWMQAVSACFKIFLWCMEWFFLCKCKPWCMLWDKIFFFLDACMLICDDLCFCQLRVRTWSYPWFPDFVGCLHLVVMVVDATLLD